MSKKYLLRPQAVEVFAKIETAIEEGKPVEDGALLNEKAPEEDGRMFIERVISGIHHREGEIGLLDHEIKRLTAARDARRKAVQRGKEFLQYLLETYKFVDDAGNPKFKTPIYTVYATTRDKTVVDGKPLSAELYDDEAEFIKELEAHGQLATALELGVLEMRAGYKLNKERLKEFLGTAKLDTARVEASTSLVIRGIKISLSQSEEAE